MFKAMKNVRGFSLLEILIATFLGVFLLGVILQNYSSAKNIYRVQDELITFNENIRLANFVLWQHIMQAGFVGCRRASEFNLDFAEDGVIRGYDSKHFANKGAIPGSDVIVISKASSDVTKFADNVAFEATSLQVRNGAIAKAGNTLLISDCKNAELVFLSEKKGKKFNLASGLKYSYQFDNTEIRRFERFSFFVAKRPNEKVLCLYFSVDERRKQELIPGVNKMNVLYGVSLGGLGVVNEYLKSNEVDSRELWGKVLIVVITLSFDSKLLPTVQRSLHIRLRSRS